MKAQLKLASSKDKKPTIRVSELTQECPRLSALLLTDIVEIIFSFREQPLRKLSYTFHPSRSLTTLYGNRPWTFTDALPKIGKPREIIISRIAVNGEWHYDAENPIIKPRPQPFPQGYLSPFKEESFIKQENKCEKLTYPVNPLDEKMERLVAEINAALVLAGGYHKGDHSAGKFTDVMRNLLSNVDKKTLVRIIENAYI